ncbi:MAG: response regulator [Aeromicrobium sp.]|nr:response regulator [Burkholderiales bacterium]
MSSLQRIMCVEDEPDIRSIVKLALEAIGGFSVLMCASGKEALEKAVAFAPDFILLDAMMPGMDGPSTLKALRDIPALANVPIAFMTAKVQSSEIAGFKALGAIDVIAKPFNARTLSDTVRSLWEQRAG